MRLKFRLPNVKCDFKSALSTNEMVIIATMKSFFKIIITFPRYSNDLELHCFSLNLLEKF